MVNYSEWQRETEDRKNGRQGDQSWQKVRREIWVGAKL